MGSALVRRSASRQASLGIKRDGRQHAGMNGETAANKESGLQQTGRERDEGSLEMSE